LHGHANQDLATVSRLLGHERLETTAIYTEPTARDLEEAVARLQREV
jgi:site-specific recombinase XerD